MESEPARHEIAAGESALFSDLREKTIALDLARQAALSTFAISGEQVSWPYDEDALWYEERPHVMDERPCDYEQGGVKVWKMAEDGGTV